MLLFLCRKRRKSSEQSAARNLSLNERNFFLSARKSLIIAAHFSMWPTFFEYADASARLLLRLLCIRLIFAWLQAEESEKAFFFIYCEFI